MTRPPHASRPWHAFNACGRHGADRAECCGGQSRGGGGGGGEGARAKRLYGQIARHDEHGRQFERRRVQDDVLVKHVALQNGHRVSPGPAFCQVLSHLLGLADCASATRARARSGQGCLGFAAAAATACQPLRPPALTGTSRCGTRPHTQELGARLTWQHTKSLLRRARRVVWHRAEEE